MDEDGVRVQAARGTARIGIDVGGTGVKGNVVDLADGTLLSDRFRVPTPHPATPDGVAGCVAEVVERLGAAGPVGVTVPSVVKDGRTLTAANIDPSWSGADAVSLFSAALDGRGVHVLNDADAAGLAEMRFGAGRGRAGVVVMLTLGTGIGSAVFLDGRLVPNTELGHLQIDGVDAETRASAAARKNETLSWSEWAARVERYLRVLEDLLWPDLVVLGGGVSKKSGKWLSQLDVRTEIAVADLRNQAGIVGAAMATAEDTSP